MLVLQRTINERIFIGNDQEIVITVVEFRNGCVRLGIEAPDDVPIFREEVLRKMEKERKAAERAERAERAEGTEGTERAERMSHPKERDGENR